MVEQMDVAAAARGVQTVDESLAKDALAQALKRFDKGGDQFYDQISALHKSVRGSVPDAALYWLCRMLDGGADPLYIGRRLVRMAVEDVGLADPRALRVALDACETYERLGSPEGELALAEAALYMAIAPKSNAVYAAYSSARALIRDDKSRPVPMHLRNAPRPTFPRACRSPAFTILRSAGWRRRSKPGLRSCASSMSRRGARNSVSGSRIAARDCRRARGAAAARPVSSRAECRPGLRRSV